MAGEILERDPVQVVQADLAVEFEGQLEPDVIISLAEEEVAALEEAPVRSFISVVAWRRARERARGLLRGD